VPVTVDTNDARVAEDCRSLRNQGRDVNGRWLTHVRLGFNYRLSDIHCALGLAQLERIEDLLSARREVADEYSRILSASKTCENKTIRLPVNRENVIRSWFVYVIELVSAAEGMNDTISTTDDLRSLSDLPALALVPESRLLRVSGTSRFIPASVTSSMRGEMLAGSPVVALLHEHSRSPEAEAIRNLDTAIRVSSLTRERPIHTILITSPFPGEAKTTVAANLAMALSRHSRTCLIDADLRHPKITPTFGVTARLRLLDALSNPEILDETGLC